MKIILTFLFSMALLFAFDIKSLEENINAQNISGKFTQIKNIKDFPMPFKSKGNFAIKNKKEIFWNIDEPIKNEIKINSNGVFIKIDKTWKKSEEGADKNILLDLFSFKHDKLKSFFNVDLNGSKDNWELNLRPKDFLLQKIFDKIILKGQKYIKSIEIYENNGDKSIIYFDVK